MGKRKRGSLINAITIYVIQSGVLQSYEVVILGRFVRFVKRVNLCIGVGSQRAHIMAPSPGDAMISILSVCEGGDTYEHCACPCAGLRGAYSPKAPTR